MREDIASTSCRCCGKLLSDPISMAAGLGTVWRINAKAQEASEVTLFSLNTRSDYDINEVDGVVCVVDLDLGGRSVTNDAEAVIADLIRDGLIGPEQCVVYRDSTGT